MKNAELRRFYAAAAALVMASGTTVTAIAEETADAETAVTTSAAEVKTEQSDYSGNFGKDVKWEYDPETKTLTVSGKGKMLKDNGDEDAAPFSGKHKWAKEVEKIVIEDGVESIENGAFEKFSSLKSVSIPESVTELGMNSFRNCISLEEVTIPSEITTIPQAAFMNCNELNKVTLPEGLKVIDPEAFRGCCSLVSVVLPNGVTKLGDKAFKHCLKLREINIPESIEEYGENIFDYEEDNEYLRIKVDGPNGRSYAYRNGSLRFEENGMLYSDTSGICGEFVNWSFDEETGVYTLTGKGIADDVPVYSEWAKNVKTVIIEEGITGIRFSGLSSNFPEVESITLPESFEGFIDDMPCGLSNLAITSIDLPDKMTVVSQGLLQHCENLKEVKLPANLKEIKNFAFLGDISLENIVIPEKTEKIGEYVFSGCSLKNVTILSKNVDIDETAFHLNESTMTICAPKGSTAEKFAADHKIKFVAIEDAETAEAPEPAVKSVALAAPVQADTVKTFKAGDADGNGVVDISDISTLALSLVDGTELTEAQKKALDVDGDGDVDLADLARLRQYLSKKIEAL